MAIKITISRAPLTAEFEVGSIGEGIAIITESKDKFIELLGLSDSMNGTDEQEQGNENVTASASESPKERKPRGKNKAPEAVAPAPIPVPAAAAPNPDGLDIPPALQRAPTPPAAAAPPPPPLLPSAPPVVPAAPPTSALAQPIIANLDQRKAGSADDGKALADWLAGAGLIAKGATYEEAKSVIPFTKHELLVEIAKALGVG